MYKTLHTQLKNPQPFFPVYFHSLRWLHIPVTMDNSELILTELRADFDVQFNTPVLQGVLYGSYTIYVHIHVVTANSIARNVHFNYWPGHLYVMLQVVKPPQWIQRSTRRETP